MATSSLTVSDALALVKGSLEQISATIVGEISELSDKPGYKAVYFTLADASAALSCLMWRNNYQRVGVELRKGMLVEVSGMFSVYAAKGRMNFEVKSLRPAGEGELRLRVAQLAKRLEAEGLMDPRTKRPLPQYPAAIALVTSPRGKAVHDVLRTLRRRYPLAEVLVVGVPVEGAVAVERIVEGLRLAQSSKAEAILLVRGGGSYEDLMPFNDERLARAIASSSLPVVAGIGHEPDNSIADMVADFRASTPTAAAEYLVPDTTELAVTLSRLGAGLTRALRLTTQRAEATVERLRHRAVFTDASSLLKTSELQVEGAARRLQQALPLKLERDALFVEGMRTRLSLLASNLLSPCTAVVALAAARLDSLSPLAVLSRGYSIACNREGRVIDTVDAVDLGEQLRVRLSDGSLECTVAGKQHEDLIDQTTEAYHD
ncbi:MAG: exodeoxyribonuclease VII large subunit [Coriobacteriales bacterium]|jgi:exodeoxyribonuclease VII large subunit|nr:exodeoxyribonuclease VII large subunit [Coriobacteriales bacterium]